MDTIFALASARGKAGVAVIRVSGPSSYESVLRLAGPVEPRRASLRRLGENGEALDEALVLHFPQPHSFTGEDVVEFHLHGSTAVVQSVLRVLGRLPGYRHAEPGEFTRRALENEKLDLTQVEGLADLIEAETEMQRRQALRVMSGAVGERASQWRDKLTRAAALIEATIDFVDEDVPVDVAPEVLLLLCEVLSDLRKEESGASAAERIRDGFEVAIVGPPNAGKSTLLNALAGRDAAITSEVAGTTRDILEVRMDLRGLPATILDTAGIREASDEVETIGVERALERASSSDLRIILCPRGEIPVLAPRDGDILVAPKSDIIDGDFSALTGEGLQVLIEDVTARLESMASSAGLAVRERHRIAIGSGVSCLDIAMDRLSRTPLSAELVAEDIRAAIRALDSLIGRVGVENLLDEIFKSFCIGK